LLVEASLQPASAGCAIHVVNPQSHAFDTLVDVIAARGHRLERLPYPAWLESVAAAVQSNAAHPLAPLLPVLRLLHPAQDPTLAPPMPLAHANLARLAPAAFAAIGDPTDWLPAMFDHLEATAVLHVPSVGGTAAGDGSPHRVIPAA